MKVDLQTPHLRLPQIRHRQINYTPQRSNTLLPYSFRHTRDTLPAVQDTFFKVSARSIASEQWGDYGDILQHGMTMHLPRVDGKLSLERTGPYIPPVTLPGLGDMVLTDAARSLLEDSGLKGFSFLPVEKTLIVDLPWHAWDRTAGEPAEYPDSGEPEDYVLSKAHNSEMARAMGDLWEVVVPFNVVVMRPHEIVESYKDLHIDLRTWDGADLLRGKEYGGILCSQRAKNWFVEQWNPYLRFDQFPAI